VLVVSGDISNPYLILFKAADLSVITAIPTGNSVADVGGFPCSDGINFWVGLHNNLLRF
jgi:hypothetical protein